MPITMETHNTSPPETKAFTVSGRNDETLTFTGQLLGFASSHNDEHSVHKSQYAPPGWKCSACRWFEVGIYKLHGEDLETFAPHKYIIHTRGQTSVPNETVFGRIKRVESVWKVLNALTQWVNNTPRLPEVSLIALEDAAEWDEDLDKALTRWLNAGA